jgi:hypothetical protein
MRRGSRENASLLVSIYALDVIRSHADTKRDVEALLTFHAKDISVYPDGSVFVHDKKVIEIVCRLGSTVALREVRRGNYLLGIEGNCTPFSFCPDGPEHYLLLYDRLYAEKKLHDVTLLVEVLELIDTDTGSPFPITLEFTKKPTKAALAAVSEMLKTTTFPVVQGGEAQTERFFASDATVTTYANHATFQIRAAGTTYHAMVWLILELLRIGHDYTPIETISCGRKPESLFFPE